MAVPRIVITIPILLFHQEMGIRDLDSEFAQLESTDNVDSAQAATATSHRDWHSIKLVGVRVKRSLSSLFSSVRAQEETLETENKKRLSAHEAFQKYHKRGEVKKGAHQAELMEICQI